MTARQSSPGGLTVADLRGSAGRRRRELVVRGVFLSAASISILVSVLIVASLAGQAIAFVTSVDLGLLVERGWFPRRELFGIQTLVAGTLLVAGIGMLVATPVGLGAAVYLSEYASPRARRVVK